MDWLLEREIVDFPAKKVRRRLIQQRTEIGSPNLTKLQSQLTQLNQFSKEDVFKVRPKLPKSPDNPLQTLGTDSSPFSLATDSSDDKSLVGSSHPIKPRHFPIPKLNLQRKNPHDVFHVSKQPRFNAIPRPHSARAAPNRYSATTPMPPRPYTSRANGERPFLNSRSHSTSDLKADPAKLYSNTQLRPAPPIATRPDRSHSRNSNTYQMHQRDVPSLSRDPSRERFLGRVPSTGNLSRTSAYDQRQCQSARGPSRHRRHASMDYTDFRKIHHPEPLQREPNSAVLGWENQEVVNWITSLGGDMAVYAPIFQENELTGEDLITLNREVLKEMHIRKLGHQNRILRARDVFCGNVRLPNSTEHHMEEEIRKKDICIVDLKEELRNVYHVLSSLQRKLEPFI